MKILEIIDLKYILIYLAVINLIALIMFFIDKKAAQKDCWRISEKALLLVAIFGGSIGAILGMRIFHHKTLKSRFNIGLPIILCVQFALIIYLWYNGYII